MNGVPLPAKHGFPDSPAVTGQIRHEAPEMDHGDQLVKDEQLGYWQQQGWSQEARMNTSVRIDVPGQRRDVDTGHPEIEGVAFSGDRGISKVEVSTDDGKTWDEATLKPPLGPYTWVLWEYAWTHTAPQDVTPSLSGRAPRTAPASCRPTTLASPYPDGATGCTPSTCRSESQPKRPRHYREISSTDPSREALRSALDIAVSSRGSR